MPPVEDPSPVVARRLPAFALSYFGGLLVALLVAGLCLAGSRVLVSETEGFRGLYVGLAAVPGAMFAWITAWFLRRSPGAWPLLAPLGVFLLLGIPPWIFLLAKLDTLDLF
ncbi:hypothetical protein [Lignipirellula cremea]|uniref:Uncharacterized protein n=1 Tax=Lignipirellula cremea TaxID=2528010 RepID=A0A518DMH8_9BACT|nr:hypothetical protein [Lignipirellula cremea]QDU93046.1 hypothetical protein Pla8534_08210 [Lignipirellula cremea]